MKLSEALRLRRGVKEVPNKNKEEITIKKALEIRELKKAKYTKRWKGKDGKWHYEYKEKKPKSSKEYMKEHATGIRKEADELKRMGEEDFKKKKGESDKKKLKEALAERTAKKKKVGKKKKVDYSDAPESKLSARARRIRLDVEDGKITMKEARKKIGIKEPKDKIKAVAQSKAKAKAEFYADRPNDFAYFYDMKPEKAKSMSRSERYKIALKDWTQQANKVTDIKDFSEEDWDVEE